MRPRSTCRGRNTNNCRKRKRKRACNGGRSLCVQISTERSTLWQYIDTTRKAIDCSTTLRLTVFSERELAFAIWYRPSVCRLSFVCRLSVCLTVCNVRAPYSGGSDFRQYLYGIRYLGHPPTNIHWKFYADRPRGTPQPGELKTRGVAKYSDFGPIDGYISETVHDRR